MLAFGLCLLLFAYWTLIGCALLWPLETRMSRVRKLLLAPSIGMAANGLPLFIFNLLGVPVSRSAWPIALVLTIASGAILWWSKRKAAAVHAEPAGEPFWRRYAPFAAILLAAGILTGRPMFLFNFDWVSFCNDDMANYCLGAHRVLDTGYFDKPDPEQLRRGRDYVAQMWFLHVPGMHRPGSELTIAFLCATTRLTAPELFMIAILAMHLCQVSALAGVMYRRPQDRLATLAATSLLALSALASLGALYQLIAQVSGVGLILVGGALLLRPMADTDDDGEVISPGAKGYLKAGILIGVIIAGLMVFYPEIFPFLAMSWLIYTVVGVAMRRLPVRPLLATLGFGTIATVAFLSIYTTVSLAYLMHQAGTGTKTDNVQRTLFPYYLMPSGLSNLWGFQPLATLGLEPWQSLAIGIGALLFVGIGVAAVIYTLRGDSVATFSLVMVAIALFLFKGRSGFGLYKLAMYAQPFFLSLLVTGWFAIAAWLVRMRGSVSDESNPARRAGFGLIALAPLFVLGGISSYTQWFYVRSSCGVGQTFNEILDASDSRVYNEFREIVAANEAQAKAQAAGGKPVKQQYLVDSYNLVLAKFQSMGNRKCEMAFPSNRFYYPGGYEEYPTPKGWQIIADANELMRIYGTQFNWEGFRVREHDSSGLSAPVSGDENASGDSAGDGDASNTFLFNKMAAEMADFVIESAVHPDAAKNAGKEVIVVVTTGKQSPFNRRFVKASDDKANFVVRRASEVSNHLVFVSSELGHPYFSGGRIKPNFAIYQLESEPLFFKGHTMAGVGRNVLFQIINPSRDPKTGKGRVRMVLEMTESYKADSDNALPPAHVIGTGEVGFPGLVGRGATRAVSDPIEPQYINGQPYVQIDMGVEGKRFPEMRSGLMKLFGTDVAIDRRALVGFLRDISLVSEEQYEAFKPPTEIKSFAMSNNDLREKTEMEYSGIYEDGWVSERSFYKLSQPAGASVSAVIRGEVPRLPEGDPKFQTHAALKVDDKIVAEQTLPCGPFELRGDLPAELIAGTSAVHKLQLEFSHYQKLPPVDGYPDGRPVSAMLTYIGLTGAPVETRIAGNTAP